jgi:hypothetical protein
MADESAPRTRLEDAGGSKIRGADRDDRGAFRRAVALQGNAVN